MSDAIRQSKLFAAEDWKVISQSFTNAEFKSYDFDTLRLAMLDIIQRNYPEDFNDYIQSSEFIALLDLVAFLGQNLSFRNDLNSREAFLDTAERRDSILKLARQLSYQPKRSRNAVGYLKIKSVNSSENILDNLGNNLSRQDVFWTATTNTDAYERFILVLNAVLNPSNQFGTPETYVADGGATIAQYGLNSTFVDYPALQFNVDINGNSTNFEIVSSSLNTNGAVTEQQPDISAQYSIIYKSDGNGNLSPGTGFFLQFKQGSTLRYDYSIDAPIANRVIDIPAANVTEDDIWVQSIDTEGNIIKTWQRVPSTNGSNLYLNELGNTERDIFEVLTANNDQVSVKFSDGNFGNIPTGLLRVIVRQGNGLSYTVKPSMMSSVPFGIPYMSKSGQPQVLIVTCDLDNAVNNAAAADSIDDIRIKAPSYYYSQNRMITGQDYASYPMTVSSGILKIKSVNRIHSGMTRYMQDKDPTGTYNDLDIFGTDGFIYREDVVNRTEYNYPTGGLRIIDVINDFEKKLHLTDLLNFYYKNYPPVKFQTGPGSFVYYNVVGFGTDYCHGYFTYNDQDILAPLRIGAANNTDPLLSQLRQGSIILFDDESQTVVGQRFVPQGPTFGNGLGIRNEYGFSTGLKANGEGVVILTHRVADLSAVNLVIPAFLKNFTASFKATLTELMTSYQTFGIAYDHTTYSFRIIGADNLNTGVFSLTNAGDISGFSLDASWLMYITYEAGQFVIRTRSTSMVIGSQRKVRFYNENFQINLESESQASTANDIITFVNNKDPSDNKVYLPLEPSFSLSNYFRYQDGYTDPTKVYATFVDLNRDRLPEQPRSFEVLVGDNTIPLGWYTDPTTGLNFELPNLNPDFIPTSRFVSGRAGLRFNWLHNAPRSQIIDPAPTNIIDIYVLLENYYNDYVTWIRSGADPLLEPFPPTSDDLTLQFEMLNNQKSVSDTIIYHPGKMLNLFGALADSTYRAQFKVVKMPGSRMSDNELKSKILNALDEYFNPSLWEFGETFYYTELAAYIHKQLVGNISSVVIVPTPEAARFGNLFQITPNEDQIFHHVATADNIDLITSITDINIRVNQ